MLSEKNAKLIKQYKIPKCIACFDMCSNSDICKTDYCNWYVSNWMATHFCE